jgi:PBP1b-binding outer membrane lipoprotein LpoB
MRYYLILISALLLTGCKKEIDPTQGKEVLKAGFVYVNPEGKQLKDPTIIVPPKLSAMPANIDYIPYEGATFKSNIKVVKDNIERDFTETPVVKWVLYDLENKKIVKTESKADINLDIASVGKYRLTQYIFKNEVESETMDMAVDSASKTVEVTALKSINSIVVDKLSSRSPYLTYSFKEDEISLDKVVN